MDEKLKKFPLFVKAQEIYELVHKVSLLIDDNWYYCCGWQQKLAK